MKTATVSIAQAKYTLLGEIERLLSSIEHGHQYCWELDSARLQGTADALDMVFPQDEFGDRLFAATNHHDVEDADLSTLMQVYRDINERYPDSALYA